MTRTPLGRIPESVSLFFVGCIAVVASLAPAPFTSASPLTTPRGDVVVSITGVKPSTQVGRTVDFKVTVNPDNTFDLRDQSSPGEGWSLTDLDVSGNIDPFTSLNYAITNNAAVPLLFTVSVTLPVSAQGPATVHGGSMGATLTDANFNGSATVATSVGVPLYRGLIDGATVLSIYPDPYLLSVSFAGQSVPVPPLNPGLPGPTLASGPALVTIGIVNQFTLSPGDIFAGNSFFVVQAVPEPGAMTLLVVSLSIVTLACRRPR